MKTFLLLVAGVLALVAISCSRKQTSTSTERLQWNMDTLVGAYDKFGRKDAKWDQTAREALTEFAKIRAGYDFERETRLWLIGGMASDAVKAGCDDPLVRYLYCRYGMSESRKTLAEKQNEFRAVAQSMQYTDYSSLRKFYASVDAADMLWQQRDTNLWPVVVQFRRAAIADLTLAMNDKKLPVEEAYFASHALFQTLERNARELTNAYYSIERPLFENWPNRATSYLIKAEFYYEYAWRGRGSGTADQLSENQKRMFFERLNEAETALNKAWSLNSKDPLVPTLMISIAEGQNKERPEMERWFERAMKLNTNNYAAAHKKLHYLYPQWHGSWEEMAEFGQQCATSTNWGGRVPLILVDVHSEIYRALRGVENRGDYWTLTNVWSDISSAYEKFSEVNPDEYRFRYPYALYAFRGGQWQVFQQQVKLLQDREVNFNYGYFGGEEAVSNALAVAKALSSRK